VAGAKRRVGARVERYYCKMEAEPTVRARGEQKDGRGSRRKRETRVLLE
jgi:hypothetical protein